MKNKFLKAGLLALIIGFFTPFYVKADQDNSVYEKDVIETIEKVENSKNKNIKAYNQALIRLARKISPEDQKVLDESQSLIKEADEILEKLGALKESEEKTDNPSDLLENSNSNDISDSEDQTSTEDSSNLDNLSQGYKLKNEQYMNLEKGTYCLGPVCPEGWPKIKGNMNSYNKKKHEFIYHTPDKRDFDKISDENIIWFKSEEYAKKANFRPALR